MPDRNFLRIFLADCRRGSYIGGMGKGRKKPVFRKKIGNLLLDLGKMVVGGIIIGGILRGDVPRDILIVSGVVAAVLLFILGLHMAVIKR